MENYDYTSDDLTADQVVNRIISLHEEINFNWKDSSGWAPVRAAEILGKSRLDRSESLARTLRLWIEPPKDVRERDARLILAWANLGALLEGTLKVFLAIYVETYLQNIVEAQASVTEDGKLQERVFRLLWDESKREAKEPGILELDVLRQFFCRRVWNRCPECKDRNKFQGVRCVATTCDRKRKDDWLLEVQQLRNAIHAFTDRPIGTPDEFNKQLRKYHIFATDLFSRLPEPPTSEPW